jgi:hypothetical protein
MLWLTPLAAQGNPRSTAIRAVAKANDLQLEEVEVDVKAPAADFLKANPLHKVPTFVGADGFVLTECIAIAVYGTCGIACPLLVWLFSPCPALGNGSSVATSPAHDDDDLGIFNNSYPYLKNVTVTVDLVLTSDCLDSLA